MGNEISVRLSQDKISGFESYQLRVKTGAIVTALRDNNRNSLKIAGLVSYIKDNDLYIDDYQSFEVYMSDVFGVKKAQAYNMASVGHTWVARDEKGNVLPESILPHEQGADWSVTKLLTFQRLGISPTEAIALCESEDVSPAMSVSKLAAVLKDYKKFRAELNGTTPEDSDDGGDDGDEPEPDAGKPKVRPLTPEQYRDKLTAMTENATGLFNEAVASERVNDGNCEAWASALNAIMNGINAFNVLFNEGAEE